MSQGDCCLLNQALIELGRESGSLQNGFVIQLVTSGWQVTDARCDVELATSAPANDAHRHALGAP